MHHTFALIATLGVVWAGAAAAVGLIAGRAIRLADEHEVPRAVVAGRRSQE